MLALLACSPPVALPDDRLVHLLARTTCAPTTADLERLRAMGEERWLREQLHPGAERELEERLSAYELYGLEPVEIYDYLAAHDSREDSLGEVDVSEVPIVSQMTEWRLLRAVESRYPLREVMVDFWYDHFNVYWDKSDLAYALPQYVDEVIRPRALGNFRDLLEAVARSPAMQIYLDNWLSSAHEEGGLNENYARELLELHTLGAEAPYTQRDVVQAARCLSGWTVVDVGTGALPEQFFHFTFDPQMHHDGDKRLMDLILAPGGGVEDGEAVLDYLAAHPRTMEGHLLPVDNHRPGCSPPAFRDAIPSGSIPFPGQPTDFAEHDQQQQLALGLPQHVAQTLPQPLRYLGQRQNQLDAPWMGRQERAESFHGFPLVDLVRSLP